MNEQLALEKAAALLDTSSEYRVLRKLRHRNEFNLHLSGREIIGIVLDVETTGLDSELDEIIELAMLKFTFSREGEIGRIIDSFQSFNEPKNGIPTEITELTGITNQQVAGENISKANVENFISDAALIIAHNAIFDRPFCEKLVPHFADSSWACSATEIPWREEGVVGSRLEYIAQSFRFFYDAHRAADDCNAVLAILSMILPKSRRSTLAVLLESARRIETRVFALGAPYDLRALLKKRGYRWNGGLNSYPRAWWRDVDPSKIDEEISFLTEIDRAIIPETFSMTARTRFKV